MSKKILFPIVLFALLCCIVSCGGATPEEKVAQKIENGEQLTKEDYDVMYNYYIDYVKTMVELAKEGDELGAVEHMSDKANSDLIKTFEKEIGDRNIQTITLAAALRLPVKPSDFYPARLKFDAGKQEQKKPEQETLEEKTEEIDTLYARPRSQIFEGEIGPYPIKLWYDLGEESSDGGENQTAITGQYTYTQNGTTLKFSGTKYNRTNTFVLDEVTSNGVNSGRFELQYTGDSSEYDLTGTFTNLNNGNKFDVRLTSWEKAGK